MAAIGTANLFRGEEGEGEVLGGCGAAAGGFFVGCVASVEGVFGLLSVQYLLDGEDLEARPGAAVGGLVQAGLGCCKHDRKKGKGRGKDRSGSPFDFGPGWLLARFAGLGGQ